MDAMMQFAMQQMFEPLTQAVIFAAGLSLLIYIVVSLYRFIYQSFGG